MQQVICRIYRSFQFVPVLSEKYLNKAETSNADAIILDLEDSIALDLKSEARNRLGGAAALLKNAGQTVFCRINSGNFEDIKAAADAGVDGLIVPSVENREQLPAVAAKLESEGSRGLIFPIIETPLGLYKLRDILEADVGVAGLMFGVEDFVLGMGSRAQPCRETVFNAAWQVAFSARAHGIKPYGLAGSLAGFKDMEAFKDLCEEARNIGFVGCPAIHPAQVEILHKAFTPSQDEIDYAKEATQAFESEGGSAISVAGRMIDYPIYYRLKQMLDEYRLD